MFTKGFLFSFNKRKIKSAHEFLRDIAGIEFEPQQKGRSMSEIKELGTIFVHNRIWVDKDHPEATDANAGTFERPLRSYETAYRRADPGDLIIVVQRDDTRPSAICREKPAT